MLVFDLFAWWYRQGWQSVAMSSLRRISGVANVFSVPILLRTLFAPWRRIITYPGASLDAKIRAWGDNMVSRCIGFTVRVLVLLTAAILMLLAAIGGFLVTVVWPLVPFVILLCLVKAVGVA